MSREQREQRLAGVRAFAEALDGAYGDSAPAEPATRNRLQARKHARIVEPVTVATTTTPAGYWGKHRRADPDQSPRHRR